MPGCHEDPEQVIHSEPGPDRADARCGCEVQYVAPYGEVLDPQLGTVFVDTATKMVLKGTPTFLSGVIWGPGQLQVQGSARVVYSGQTAAASFLQTGGFLLNNTTTACAETLIADAGATPAFCCNVALSAKALDGPACAPYDGGAGALGFGGTAIHFGGGSITNGGP